MNPKLQQLIAEAKARSKQLLEEGPPKSTINTSGLPSSISISTPKKEEKSLVSAFKEVITSGGKSFNPYYIEGVGDLNEQQCLAVKLFGLEGKSGNLIGPAGTGKTTTMKAIIRAAIMSGRLPIFPDDMTHKYLTPGLPGIYLGSFTRIATRNLRDNTPDDIKPNVHTLHRLLEFEPDFKDVLDPKTDKMKTIRYFRPTRTKVRPLPKQLKTLGIDEASMVGVKLHQFTVDAAPRDAQFIYIGDLAQLPPVFDDAILGYKLLELPTVELTHVYRHAGVIVNLANYVRVGNTIPPTKTILPYLAKLHRLPRKLVEEGIKEWNKEEDGSKVTLHLWKSRLEGEVGQLRALQNISNFFIKELKSKNYIPEEHMILVPYNKAVGSIEINKLIAQYLGKERNAEVYEVIAGYNKYYLAVGDKVFYDREESIITKISVNGTYSGRIPQLASVTLDRWGHNTAGKAQNLDGTPHFDSIDNLLNISVDDDEERKNQASHVIYVKKLADFDDDGQEYRVDSAAEVNTLIGGYALTVHKSQGSQWKKVYCIFHNSHNRNLQRELLYTAITRAQKELYVICEPETFIQGVISQHIIGNTLAQKAEYFKGKIDTNKARDDLFNQEDKQ